MDISERLRSAITESGLSIKEFCHKSGVPYRSMQNYLAGSRMPGADVIGQICTQTGINANWLLTGEGPMLRGETPQAQPTPVPSLPELTPEDPLARRKAAVKMMMEQLVDQIDDPEGLDEIQVDLQKIKRTKDLEREVAELRRKAG